MRQQGQGSWAQSPGPEPRVQGAGPRATGPEQMWQSIVCHVLWALGFSGQIANFPARIFKFGNVDFVQLPLWIEVINGEFL